MEKGKDYGYVYIMTNPSFKENIIKVGKAKDPEKRCEDLSTATGIPTKFEIYALMKTKLYDEVEKALHNILEKVVHNRVNRNREFFELPPDEAYFLMKQLEPFIEDAEITLAHEQKDNTFTPDKNVNQKYEKAENMSLESYTFYNENKELYDALKVRLLGLTEGVSIVYKKMYVAFKTRSNFADVMFQKRGLKIAVNMSYKDVKDPKGITRDMTNTGHNGNGDVEIMFDNMAMLEDVMDVVKQAVK